MIEVDERRERRIGVILNLHQQKFSRESNTSETYPFLNIAKKPIEIYYFIDPLCPKCWSMDPYFKKFSIEFGRFFTVRSVISNHLNIVEAKQKISFYDSKKHVKLDSSVNGVNHFIESYPAIIMAIKAAELQGKNVGYHFLKKIQERFFIKKENITDLTVLLKCAHETSLDIEEFLKDLNSESAKRASQCDIKITKEMKVKQAPTLVFFNHLREEDGVKVSGNNPYDIYIYILSDLLKHQPIPSKKPTILEYLERYNIVSLKEISIVYDLGLEEVERELKKLQLLQVVSKVEIQNEVFWKYNYESKLI